MLRTLGWPPATCPPNPTLQDHDRRFLRPPIAAAIGPQPRHADPIRSTAARCQTHWTALDLPSNRSTRPTHRCLGCQLGYSAPSLQHPSLVQLSCRLSMPQHPDRRPTPNPARRAFHAAHQCPSSDRRPTPNPAPPPNHAAHHSRRSDHCPTPWLARQAHHSAHQCPSSDHRPTPNPAPPRNHAAHHSRCSDRRPTPNPDPPRNHFARQCPSSDRRPTPNPAPPPNTLRTTPGVLPIGRRRTLPRPGITLRATAGVLPIGRRSPAPRPGRGAAVAVVADK